MTDITRILSQIEDGDPNAAEHLLPLVYEELRKLAAAKLANEKPGQTLQATALVHEAYVRLVDIEKAQHWNSRGHFFGAAAEAMRRILVDNISRKQRPKHGGDWQRVNLDDDFPNLENRESEVLAVNDAWEKLASESEEKAALVKLRYFAGMSLEESAEALEISRSTAARHWVYAKVFLYCALEEVKIPEENP